MSSLPVVQKEIDYWVKDTRGHSDEINVHLKAFVFVYFLWSYVDVEDRFEVELALQLVDQEEEVKIIGQPEHYE
jgi:hypothetical protein